MGNLFIIQLKDLRFKGFRNTFLSVSPRTIILKTGAYLSFSSANFSYSLFYSCYNLLYNMPIIYNFMFLKIRI
ncbi:hypothetical protein B6U80_01980 [Candidatus Pacearchaeota archaeon ex4484_26]|nr:MAG: hypothetical protein B6U80_01980 [Candidatus Pacearchaeota archaeon ex4484_26]